MSKLFSEHDPDTGLTTTYSYVDGKLVETVESSDAATRSTLDLTTRLSNDADYSRQGIKKDWWHVAEIPAEVWLKWKQEGFDIFTASTSDVIKKLRDPDYSRLRTTSGKF